MKIKSDDLLVVSKILDEADEVEKRYKSLKKTIKNLKRFNAAQIRGEVAEA